MARGKTRAKTRAAHGKSQTPPQRCHPPSTVCHPLLGLQEARHGVQFVFRHGRSAKCDGGCLWLCGASWAAHAPLFVDR